MQIIWSQIFVDCSPEPFPLQSVTPKGRVGLGRGTRLPDERLSLNNSTKPFDAPGAAPISPSSHGKPQQNRQRRRDGRRSQRIHRAHKLDATLDHYHDKLRFHFLPAHCGHHLNPIEVCQTQPIKMTWCPLRLFRQTTRSLRGGSKGRMKWMSTASPVTMTWRIKHWAMA